MSVFSQIVVGMLFFKKPSGDRRSRQARLNPRGDVDTEPNDVIDRRGRGTAKVSS